MRRSAQHQPVKKRVGLFAQRGARWLAGRSIGLPSRKLTGSGLVTFLGKQKSNKAMQIEQSLEDNTPLFTLYYIFLYPILLQAYYGLKINFTGRR